MQQLTVWIAFAAGIASFISPCCLPLYPSYLSYMTGISASRLKGGAQTKEVRLQALAHSACFATGISIVFFTAGFGIGLLSDLFIDYKDLVRQLSALLIFLMGLFMLGIFQPQFLLRDRKWQFRFKPAGYIGSLFIGIGFAAGWSPCVGPILSAILALAASQPGAWFPLITAYSLGFAVPFVALALFIGSTRWILNYSALLMKIGGAVMLVIAVLLYTDRLYEITVWFQSHTPEWLKSIT